MNSITQDLAALLHGRIDLKYCSDGPLLLFFMCQNVHRTHLAFIESVKHKIRKANLQEFQNDVPKYLRFLTDNLKLISLTGATENEHNDLLPHLLLQLRGTTIPTFQQAILKWQRDYNEGKLSLTPSKLVLQADNECQILKHTGQWVETIDPSVIAMQAIVATDKTRSGEIFTSLAANFSAISQRQKEIHRSMKPSSAKGAYNVDTPDWLLQPPNHPGQIKHFNGRDWYFCTKCGCQGRWVCTHMDETHDNNRHYTTSDDFRRSHSPSPSSSSHHRSPSYSDYNDSY